MVLNIDPKRIEQEKLYREMGLSDEEYQMAKEVLGRYPNYTETGIFSVMWSEHCSYKTSRPLLRKFPTEGPQVIMGPGEGAGVVDIGDGQAVVFKMESHNSPSAVEPFEGAATGVGGIVRDVFSMGARPIALLNALRFGELSSERNRYLFKEVVRGMAHYGNTLEVPTIAGEVQFDDSFDESPLVNAMCIGLIDHENIQRGVAEGVGNVVIYAGRDTGKDGIHGATFSSDEIAEDEEHTSSVAIGDPTIEKKLIEACLEVVQSDALVGMQDMGAAGLTSSASEMASSAGTGVELNLDHVPLREENMNAYEIMLSESQERMLLVVKKGREDEIINIFKKHDVHACAIGEVIEEKMFRIVHKGEVMANIPVDNLDEAAPVYYMPSEEAAYFKKFQQMEPFVPTIEDYTKTLKRLLEQPTISDKQWIYNQFDTNAQKQTVAPPSLGAGAVQIPGYDKAVASVANCNSRYVFLDPYNGGKIAVAEAARELVCSGARPLGLTDGLNYGNPTNPEIFWQMEQSIEGISEACLVLETPVVSGNVSLYNQSKHGAVFPTPIIGMVGLHKSLKHITPSTFQEAGDLVYVIGEAEAAFGGSELQKLLNKTYEGKVPSINLAVEKERQTQLLQAIEEGIVQSAYNVGKGGLAVALAKAISENENLGLSLTISKDVTAELFSETQSRMVVSIKQENKAVFEELVQDAKKLGEVTADGQYVIRHNGAIVIDESVKNLNNLWRQSIPCILSENK
ncbi:MAG TPA: phosphoribosylformylglycinamidine synthase subunit PurL [Bacillota bacterium]|nr:phosphoribosylformylglycinamidine synthase subunit PurL [Bacillota bacterium]